MLYMSNARIPKPKSEVRNQTDSARESGSSQHSHGNVLLCGRHATLRDIATGLGMQIDLQIDQSGVN